MCLKELCCLRDPLVDGDRLKHEESRNENNPNGAWPKPKLPKSTDHMPNADFRDPYTPPKEESPRRAPRYSAEEESSVSPHKNNNRGAGSYPQPQRPKNEVHSRIQGRVRDDDSPSRFETADTIESRMLKKGGRTDEDSNGRATAKSQAKTDNSRAGRVEATQAKEEVKYPF